VERDEVFILSNLLADRCRHGKIMTGVRR